VPVHGLHQPVKGVGRPVRLGLVEVEEPPAAFLAQLEGVLPHGAVGDALHRSGLGAAQALGHSDGKKLRVALKEKVYPLLGKMIGFQ